MIFLQSKQRTRRLTQERLTHAVSSTNSSLFSGIASPRVHKGDKEWQRGREERGLDLGCGRRVRSSKTACAMERCGILRSVVRCTITSTHADAEWRQKLTECCHRIPAGNFMAADFQQYPPPFATQSSIPDGTCLGLRAGRGFPWTASVSCR